MRHEVLLLFVCVGFVKFALSKVCMKMPALIEGFFIKHLFRLFGLANASSRLDVLVESN